MIANFYFLGREVSAYLLICLAGVLLTLLLTYRLTERRGLDPIRTLTAMLIGFGSAVIGSHILYGFTVFAEVRRLFAGLFTFPTWAAFARQFSLAFGGAVFYGGLLAGVFAAMLYLHRERQTLGAYADLCTVGIPFFHSIGRLGCFFSGCCFGIEMEGGIVYRHSMLPMANGVPRFPVQLAESACNVLIFLFLLSRLKRGKGRGRLLLWYLLLYSAARFLLEFLRGDDYRGFVGVLSTSQFISVLLILLVTILFLANARKNARG